MRGKVKQDSGDDVAVFWSRAAIAREIKATPGTVEYQIRLGNIPAPTRKIGRRHYYSPTEAAKVIEFFANLKKKNENFVKYWTQKDLQRELGICEPVFAWHQLKGNVPEPEIKTATLNLYSPKQAERIKRFFLGLDEMKRKYFLLMPGMEAVGMTRAEQMFFYNHEDELLADIPYVTYGKQKRNRWFTLKQMELVKRRTQLARAGKERNRRTKT